VNERAEASPARGPASSMESTLANYALYSGRYRRLFRLAVVVTITVVIAATRPGPGVHGDGLVILVSLVVAVAAHLTGLAAFDRAPTTRVAIELVASAVLAGFDPGSSAAFLALAGLDAAALLPLAPGAYALGFATVVELLCTLAAGNPPSDGLEAFVAVAGFLFGTTRRQYEMRAEQAELRLADLERADQERARAVHLAERASSAREIHDILAHNLGALVMRLNAANAILDSEQPNVDSLRPLLRDAHRDAAEGLKEAREVVASLREEAVAPVDVSLHQLVDASSHATLEIHGAPRPVSAAVAAALRRTAQEALTNTSKHAPGATSAVRIDFRPASIVLTVTDTGRSPAAAPSALAGTGGGYGLAGMRERAELIGAQLTAGPSGGGWQVTLAIPEANGR
jgi:signal transduction histidine kinase